MDDPVSIRVIEWNIIDRGFDEGWVVAVPPERETGQKVAVIGSGPAGLAAAQQLRRAGHSVTVFEKDDRIGGLLRYGIPDFKMEKTVIDRRLEQMRAEGVEFRPESMSVKISRRMNCKKTLMRSAWRAARWRQGTCRFRDVSSAVSTWPWSTCPTEQAKRGRHNRFCKENFRPRKTSRDHRRRRHRLRLLGTTHRQGAADVFQFELLPQPPPNRDSSTRGHSGRCSFAPRTAHEEGCKREWSVSTKRFSGETAV